MDSNSIIKDNKKIYDLTDVFTDAENGNTQEVIIVDGRGYEKSNFEQEEVFTLLDVVDDPQARENLYKEILKRSEAVVERIARQVVPEIAEKMIRAEIEKIKKETETEQ